MVTAVATATGDLRLLVGTPVFLGSDSAPLNLEMKESTLRLPSAAHQRIPAVWNATPMFFQPL